MLLEIENELHKKVHSVVGQSAVVLRLAEDLESSGAVAENTNIVVSFASGITENPHKGTYIPTVRNRKLTYKIVIIQKQSQRVGHSFALPFLDLLADAITGWVPCIKGLKFQTGFELSSERFTQITEASQYIYEQNYDIEVLIPDGRMVSSICAATDPINLCDYLPSRRCLTTQEGLYTSLAVWKIKTDFDQYDEYIVIDYKQCNPDGELTYVCNTDLNGEATYTFTPFSAYEMNPVSGLNVLNESKVITGVLKNFIPCLKDPPNIRIKVLINLWLNAAEKVPENKDPRYSSIVPTNLDIFGEI